MQEKKKEIYKGQLRKKMKDGEREQIKELFGRMERKVNACNQLI